MKIRKTAALLLAAAVILALAGCNGQTKAAETNAVKTTEETAAAEIKAAETTGEAVKTEETEAAETKAEESSAGATAAETAAAETAVPETEAEEMPPRDASEQLHPIASRIYESAQRNDNTFLYEAKGVQLFLNDEEAAALPCLDAALREDYNEYVTEGIRDFCEKFKAASEEQRIELDGVVPYDQKAEIARMDSNMASIVSYRFVFMGGTHGYTEVRTFNYDARNSSTVGLSTIVKDDEALRSLLTKRLKAEYPDVNFFDLENDMKKYSIAGRTDDEGKYSWTMNYDSITFYFQEEKLASHADGMQTVTLAFADYPELLTNRWGSAPENRIVFLPDEASVRIGADTVKSAVRLDENGTCSKLLLTVNGKETSFDIFAHKVESYFVKKGNHRLFYVFTEGDDDERLFRVYTVDGDQVTEQQTWEARLAVTYKQNKPMFEGTDYNYYEAENTYTLPADPAGVKLELKKDGAWKEAAVTVDENGKAVIN